MVESIQAVQRDLVGTMQKLAEKVEKLELDLDASQRRYQPPRRGRAMADPGWGIWGKFPPSPLHEIAYKIEIL